MKVVEKDKVISGMLRDELKRCREMLESLENRCSSIMGTIPYLSFFATNLIVMLRIKFFYTCRAYTVAEFCLGMVPYTC